MEYWELQTCWNYFLSIDRDLAETSRYIEPEGQEDTRSFEFYKIIILACSEVESAFKQLCNVIDGEEKCGDISDYKRIILSKYPKICDSKVVVKRWRAREIQPFSGWNERTLEWWSEYSSLKHNRFTKFDGATYKNAVYALAALYVLILYLYIYKTNRYTCKADDSICFWSEYHPGQHYLDPISELPDFETNNRDEQI